MSIPIPNRYSVFSVNSAIRSRIDRILFHSFHNQNRSPKNSITANSVYSHSGIAPKERALKHTGKTKFNAGFIRVFKQSTNMIMTTGIKFIH